MIPYAKIAVSEYEFNKIINSKENKEEKCKKTCQFAYIYNQYMGDLSKCLENCKKQKHA